MRSPIGIVTKDQSKQVTHALRKLVKEILRLHASVYVETQWKGLIPRRSGGIEFASRKRLLQEAKIIFSFGGDGTVVRLAHDLGGRTTPVVGVNFGRLGYLSYFNFDDRFLSMVPVLLTREHLLVDERRLLKIAFFKKGKKRILRHALNEVLVNSAAASLIHVDCSMNKRRLTMFIADGVIVATPTGSTAYALSAGGPIVDPAVGSLVIVPISPHVLSNRPLVISEENVVSLSLNQESRGSVTVSFDGNVLDSFYQGDRLEVRLSKEIFVLVANRKDEFFHRLTEKLHWNVR